MKKWLAGIVSMVLALCWVLMVEKVHAESNLSDIESHWAKAAIIAAVDQGYVTGYPDGTFRPNNNVTRAEFIKMIVDAMGLPHSSGASPWYMPYVASSIEFGLHIEEDFSTYTEEISRLEIMRLAARALNREESYEVYFESFSTLYNGDIPFVDYRELEEEDVAFAALVLGAKVMNGYPDASMGLSKSATRAEAVVIIENVLKQRLVDPGDMQYLRELKEIAETGTNAKTVSPLEPEVNFIEDDITKEHWNYSVKLKRVYVIPFEGDIVSFYERKFVWERDKVDPFFTTEYQGFVIGVTDMTFKKSGNSILFASNIILQPGAYFYEQDASKKFDYAFPGMQEKFVAVEGDTSEVVIYGSYQKKKQDIVLRVNPDLGYERLFENTSYTK